MVESARRLLSWVLLAPALCCACAWPAEERTCPRGRDRICIDPELHGAVRRTAMRADAGRGGSTAAARDAAAGAQAPSDDAAERAILAGEVVNARDLGGTRLPDGSSIARGKLFRGPTLALSEAGCDELAALGVRTIVDLRELGEGANAPDAPCVQQQAATVLAPLPIPYTVSPEDYLADLNTTGSIAAAFSAFGDEQAYPVYFHCTIGRDRTGIVASLILLALGADRETIMEEYLRSRPNVGAYPDSLGAVLDDIDRRGGIDQYFADAGIPAQWIDGLRATMIEAAR